jgi:hypothetical protein
MKVKESVTLLSKVKKGTFFHFIKNNFVKIVLKNYIIQPYRFICGFAELVNINK